MDWRERILSTVVGDKNRYNIYTNNEKSGLACIIGNYKIKIIIIKIIDIYIKSRLFILLFFQY